MQLVQAKVQVVQVAAVREAQELEQRALQIQAAVAVVAVMVLVAQQAALALSSSPTQAHNEALAAQSHQAVATPFIHSHLAAHLQLN